MRSSHTIIVFSLFTLVKFDNGICGGSNGENGTCVAAAECARRGGVSSSVCANGYGVCCIGNETVIRRIRHISIARENSLVFCISHHISL